MQGKKIPILNGLRECANCHQPKAVSDFYPKPRQGYKAGMDSFCKICRNAKSSLWHKQNRPKVRLTCRKWQQENRATYRQSGMKHYIKKAYGLTLEEYTAQKESQAGICGMCGEKTDGRLVLDHCHETNKNRDFLCDHCNTFIGHIEKNPSLYEQAMTHLWKHKMSGGMAFPCPTK